MTQLIRHNLHRAQQRMKHQEDKHRQEREFTMGDWVYVKLQPYVQQYVEHRLVHKLSYKYFGPYLILQCIGAVAYKLQLPSTSKIHPVFHVSQPKKALPPNVQPLSDAQLIQLDSTASPSQPRYLKLFFIRLVILLLLILVCSGECLHPGVPGRT